MAYRILDISTYQPDVKYAETAKDVDGVILRIGLTYWGKQVLGKDNCFEKHYAGFKAVNCPVGVYFYSCADTVAFAQKEADYCLELMKNKQFELPVYYDVENSQRQGSLSKQALTDIVDAFCSRVEKAGYFVGFYASTSWLTNKMDTASLSKKYTLWKADYRTNYDKTIKCDMHQYTSTGSVKGISGNVDISHCYVDFPSIIKKAGLNGFGKVVDSTPSKDDSTLSKDACRLKIGAMSGGDINTIVVKLAELKIDKFTITADGYIITDMAVTYGDKKTIEAECNRLGNINIVDYIEEEKVAECSECATLKAQVADLNEKLKAALALEEKISMEYASLKAENERLNKVLDDISKLIAR